MRHNTGHRTTHRSDLQRSAPVLEQLLSARVWPYDIGRLALMTCLLMHPQTKCRSSSKGPLARFSTPWRINLEGKVGPFQPQLPKCFVFADAPLGRRGIQALQTSDLAGLAIMGCLTSPSQGVSEHHFGPLGPDAPRSRPFSRLSPLPKGFLNTTKISRTHHVPTYRNIVRAPFAWGVVAR